MNETLLFLLLAAVCILIGAFIGNLFARLKLKSETGKLEERINQLLHQEEKLNERCGNLEIEKEKVREEKERVNVQLSRQIAEHGRPGYPSQSSYRSGRVQEEHYQSQDQGRKGFGRMSI